jgi:hypothetical protein
MFKKGFITCILQYILQCAKTKTVVKIERKSSLRRRNLSLENNIKTAHGEVWFEDTNWIFVT